MIVEIPGLRLVSEANAHEHYRVRVDRAAAHHDAVAMHLRPRRKVAPPAVVVVTRLAPGSLDSDNLQGSAKHVRDAIAKWMGVDDRDPRVTWRVAQERTRAGIYGVRLDIRGWDASRVGARVVAEGAVQRAELVLDAPALRAWAESLSAMADGARADSRLALGDVEILVRAAGGAR